MESIKLLPFLICFYIGFFLSSHSTVADNFLHCLSDDSSSNPLVFTQTNTSYPSLLYSNVINLRFSKSNPTTAKPYAIVTPLTYSHVQSAVLCAKKHGFRIRIRSGGHDYEGLSYTSYDHAPFIVLDLRELRSVNIDSDDNTVWVESGATVGELYYWASKKSPNLGFPAGICPTVGVGGHLSGGGLGTMVRKYGLAADNVIDARIVDVNGQILDRESMGEDLFWAIRGGGGASFGVILAWKVNLVYVPDVVTVFSHSKTIDQGATSLFIKWQQIGHKLSEDLFIRVVVEAVVDEEGNRTIQTTFNSMFLGKVDKLLGTLNESFPELGLEKKDCIEMSWIESILYFSIYLRGESIDALRDREPEEKSYFSGKSDYVKEPIPEEAVEEMWKWCLEEDNPILIMDPHGGRMSEIEETETPYPYRKGYLYNIQYFEKWEDEGFAASEKHISWMRRIYEKMTPYVTNNPRAAYLNYRDLDLGANDDARTTSYLQAAKWGTKYFNNNFRRLAKVKGEVDPDNFFYFEQSIPPLSLSDVE